ncbi:MAG: hypothetical protein WCC59_06000, partial [Terriglobales bacterium]
AAQQLLQRIGGERLFGVVHRLKLDAFRGQDPPDLAAGASGRLFVDRDSFASHGVDGSSWLAVGSWWWVQITNYQSQITLPIPR